MQTESKAAGATLDAKTKAMIRDWLERHHGDVEGVARWMARRLRIGSLRQCRKLIEEALA